MSDDRTVHIQAALLEDPRYWTLTPTQARALPSMIKLMAQHGKDGALHWTRKEICKATGLRPALYEGLLVFLKRHEWGCENGEGWLVLSGLAEPASATPVPQGADLQQIIAESIKAAVPDIIREYEAARKRRSRAVSTGKEAEEEEEDVEMSGTSGENVPDKEAEEEEPVPDSPSRTRTVESIDSNRVEEDNILFFDSSSIRIDSKGDTSPPSTPDPPPKLMIVDADIIQVMGGYGILETTARGLIHTYGSERCALVLAAIPIWKPRNPAERIHAALKRPDKWPLPPQVTQQTLGLLTGQKGGTPKTAPVVKPEVKTETPAPPPEVASDDTEAVEQLAWGRLSQTTRDKILECEEADHQIPALIAGQWNEARRAARAALERLSVKEA